MEHTHTFPQTQYTTLQHYQSPFTLTSVKMHLQQELWQTVKQYLFKAVQVDKVEFLMKGYGFTVTLQHFRQCTVHSALTPISNEYLWNCLITERQKTFWPGTLAKFGAVQGKFEKLTYLEFVN